MTSKAVKVEQIKQAKDGLDVFGEPLEDGPFLLRISRDAIKI